MTGGGLAGGGVRSEDSPGASGSNHNGHRLDVIDRVFC